MAHPVAAREDLVGESSAHRPTDGLRRVMSASHTIVEIEPDRTVQDGDVATFFDWEDDSRPEDANAASGASVYDPIMHLNPTLPRRIVT